MPQNPTSVTMMSFDHLLNRPAEEVAYSHPAGSIPSPSSPGHPSASSPTARAHKYSNSGASTASFVSSSGTHPFGSHSRTSSYSTNPETPPAENFPPDNFRIASNDGDDKMADMADPIDVVDKFMGGDAQAPRRAYPFASKRTIDLTEEDDRAESPTDAIMPMMRRAPADPSRTSSPLTYSRAPAALDAMADPAPSEDRKVLGSDSDQSAAVSAPAAEQSGAMSAPASGQSGPPMLPALPANAPSIFPPSAAYNPGGARRLLRLSPTLISMVVPHIFQSVDRLMEEVDFLADRVCKYMEGVCHMTADVDQAKINWRKAMSHVFGRNKNCTRSIPDRVWLWFCRKHYQRGRYRNGHDYAKKQVWAVTVQVLRLEAWSNYNQDMGVPQDGVVVDWTLDIRRREQLRLEDAGRKRKMSDDMDDHDEGDDEPESPVTPDSGLVPQWLLNERGGLKTTADIIRILGRIRRELDAGILTNFPDVEILPTITGERAKPKANRAKPRNPPVRRALPQRPKRQRLEEEEEEEDEAASYGARHRGGRVGRFGDHPNYGYGNAANPPGGTWGAPPQDQARSHMRTRSLDVGPYGPAAFQGGPSAGYPPPPNGYAAYHQQVGYGQNPVQNRDYMRDNVYQNGYWDPGYDARQRAQQAQQVQAQQAQQQQAVYPHNAYYQPGTGAGAPQGGPPSISAAKHSRNLSTPVRSSSMMMGGRPQDAYNAAQMGRPQEAYNTPQMTSREGLAQSGYNTPQMASREGLARASHESSGTYPAPGNRYQTYGGLPMPAAAAPSDNIPRAAEYRAAEYGTPLQSRHAGHGAAPPADGYEPYPPSLRRQ